MDKINAPDERSIGAKDAKPTLKRQLTLFQGVSVICELMIGSGIYTISSLTSPTTTMQMKQ